MQRLIADITDETAIVNHLHYQSTTLKLQSQLTINYQCYGLHECISEIFNQLIVNGQENCHTK
jgi:hypothetical protein